MNIIYKLKDMNVAHPTENEVGVVRKTLVNYKGNFYIVSENTVLKETLIFRSDPVGEVEDYNELGGGRGLTVEDIIADFEGHLYDWYRTHFDLPTYP